MLNHLDTIVALATPSGRGGVGIIRISGPNVASIATVILKKLPAPRYAQYQPFFDRNSDVLDEGIALFFKAPHSFTGEDVLELQGHGGPVILDCIIKEIIALGARLARPGEFSERAFLNNKWDLSQAEAIADLINAASEQAARCAVRSLQGDFSNEIHALVEKITALRIFVEAAIDFPEEEIDFLSDDRIKTQLDNAIQQLEIIQKTAKQGAILREGITLVIAGKPNAGKSSLLNRLTGRESAIVTEIPGTTRDVLREYIHLDGIPLHIIDTAGLRESEDRVEQEGIRRAWQEIKNADHILFIIDSTEYSDLDPTTLWSSFIEQLPEKPISVIRNKIDLTKEPAQMIKHDHYTTLSLSAKTGEGLNVLIEHLKACIGFNTQTEGRFIARRRHLDALDRAGELLKSGQQQLSLQKAGELLAEDLRLAQATLGEITGQIHSDELLGKIFSSFCIGK